MVVSNVILQSKHLKKKSVTMTIRPNDTQSEIINCFIAHLYEELMDKGLSALGYSLNQYDFKIDYPFRNQKNVNLHWRNN